MDGETIVQLSQLKNKEKVQDFYTKALSFLTASLGELVDSRLVQNFDETTTKIFPMGEYTNNTFIDELGELEIVVASSNPQLVLSNSILVKHNNKKQEQKLLMTGTYADIIPKLAQIMSQYFAEKTTFLLVDDGLKIFCANEFGFKILIRFATYSEGDTNAILSFWNPLKNCSEQVNLFAYNEQMDLKDSLTKGNYKKIVRIFKNIRKTILINKWMTASQMNKYFVELIVFNVPNTLLAGEDIKKVFYKTLNFLQNCNISKFNSFDGNPLDTFALAEINYSNIKTFLHYISKLI
ncbi:MAG: hypothetical protein ACI4L7_04175 [Christensenellales bacterium]